MVHSTRLDMYRSDHRIVKCRAEQNWTGQAGLVDVTATEVMTANVE
jgi:hypothetical protein